MWNLDFREAPATDLNKNDISMKVAVGSVSVGSVASRKRRWSEVEEETTAASNASSPSPSPLPARATTAEPALPSQSQSESGQRVCAECVQRITDQWVLQVSERWWHVRCLRCSVCRVALDQDPSCFMRDDQLYCRADYAKMFGTKCSKCCRSISASDWVRKARDLVYHLACFACDACHRQLSSGEEFALLENRVLCKTHYLETMDLGSTSSDEGGDSEGYHKNKAKRVRTTFTEEQLQVLQANFVLDSNPDGQDLERIAQVTGLSKRVVQVWFQNARARQKKHLHNNKIKSQAHHPGAHLQRDAGDGAFGGHINLHLTYSFSGQHGKAPPPIGPPSSQPSALYHHEHAPSETSSMDELSQDSMLHCMRGEV
ncbi:LIM/homeobox protein Awh isoform X2 [Frankliniella occidentalis]|uniref:LIM/homeobox protein Awh isoform X2 n=1 Tax=Frankliniella occidentalis TaxID=133901 RepID=A0A9C6XTP6_FRAOC|nr:LIM/homeobox protein Awh isoform X2 [Frankliniella occidentalis]